MEPTPKVRTWAGKQAKPNEVLPSAALQCSLTQTTRFNSLYGGDRETTAVTRCG